MMKKYFTRTTLQIMKLKKMNDEECLNKFLEFLDTRVSIDTKFVVNDEGNITHQILVIACGEFMTVSQPQPLEVILRPAMAEELGLIVN